MNSDLPRTHKWKQFLSRMTAATGLSEHDLLDRLQGAGASSVRINPLHPDGADAIREHLLERWPALDPLPDDPTALLCNDDAPFHEMVDLADEGRIYLQNASSLFPVLALDPQPGDRVLDVAAAPGGKAFNIAGKTGNVGELWLNDAVKPRLDKLARLAELYHVQCASFTDHKAQYIDKFLPAGYFDRILVDAQCTGEGRFDLRRRSALQHWSEERLTTYMHLQTKMVTAASRLLAPGGTIVYSTCTISPEENELPVSKVLERNDDLDLAPIEHRPPDAQAGLTRWQGQRLDARLDRAMRILPSERFEGFFVAKLVKR